MVWPHALSPVAAPASAGSQRCSHGLPQGLARKRLQQRRAHTQCCRGLEEVASGACRGGNQRNGRMRVPQYHDRFQAAVGHHEIGHDQVGVFRFHGGERDGLVAGYKHLEIRLAERLDREQRNTGVVIHKQDTRHPLPFATAYQWRHLMIPASVDATGESGDGAAV